MPLIYSPIDLISTIRSELEIFRMVNDRFIFWSYNGAFIILKGLLTTGQDQQPAKSCVKRQSSAKATCKCHVQTPAHSQHVFYLQIIRVPAFKMK